MVQTKTLSQKYDLFLITILLVMSGNPIVNRQTWVKEAVVIVGISLLIIFRQYIHFTFIKKFFKYLLVFFLIFLLQYLYLDYISIPFLIGFILKVFIGAFIFYQLGNRFSLVLFQAIFWIALLSFPLYIFHFIVGDGIIEKIVLLTNTNSIGLYTFRPIFNEPILRNSGIFWEPGAFQAFINVCLFLNLKRLKFLWKEERFKFIIIILALLTTQSTTGYLVLFLIIVIHLSIYFKTNFIVKTFIIFIFLGITYISFAYLPFLGNKLGYQYQSAISTDLEYTNGRFGSLIFDLNYIKKHPLIGNGFNIITRYADNPEIIYALEDGDTMGFSNGFSDFIASAGILGIAWYFIFLIYFRSEKNRSFLWLLSLLLIVLFQGEAFLNFPFFIALPFISVSYD